MTGVVGVMKDKELKLEEIESSHTLGGGGDGRCRGIIMVCVYLQKNKKSRDPRGKMSP